MSGGEAGPDAKKDLAFLGYTWVLLVLYGRRADLSDSGDTKCSKRWIHEGDGSGRVAMRYNMSAD